ncbi:MAG: hypothetical protein LBR99_06235 [Treponema sp.]|jgi:hypothetical protein|nr:hypothetical protein [Treponema sp.]
MNKKTVLITLTALLFSSCLQATYDNNLLDYVPSVAGSRELVFSASAGSDMFTLTIYGSVFQTTLDTSWFKLEKIGDPNPVVLNVPVRDSDTQVIFAFDNPLDGNYKLTIYAEAFQDAVNRVTGQAEKSGVWSSVGDTVFGRSVIRGIAYGNGRFAAVADEGQIAYSSDGTRWTAIRPGYNTVQSQFTETINDIAYGDGKFVAVGAGSRMGSSDNGMSWYGWTESFFDGAGILCITYGGDKFVTGGEWGRMAYLRDGGNWTQSGDTRFGANSILALAYGKPYDNGIFVAVGEGGQLSVSQDGANWEYRESMFGGSTIRGIAYGTGVFVTAGDSGKMAYSYNGYDWQAIGNSPFDSSGILDVAFGSGVFVAVGHNGKMARSGDGINWTVIPPDTSAAGSKFTGGEQITTVCYGGGKFVAAGSDYAVQNNSKIVYGYQKPPIVETPYDIVSAAFNSPAGYNKITITLKDGVFVDAPLLSGFTLEDGTGGFSTLTGGIFERISDTQVTIKNLSSVATPGSGQKIKVSASALAIRATAVMVTVSRSMIWQTGTSAFGTSHIRAMAHNGSKYIAVGAGKIASSSDGIAWTEVTGPEKDKWAEPDNYVDFYSIAYGGGVFVAVGYWVNGGVGGAGWGAAAVSSDGASWTMYDKLLTFTDENISPRIYGVSYGNDKFIAVGRWGRSAYSTNGSTWTAVQIAPFNYLDNQSHYEDVLTIAHGDGIFIVGGRNGKAALVADNLAQPISPGDWKWVADGLLGSYVDINSLSFGSSSGNSIIIAAGNGGNMKTAASASVKTDANEANWEGVDSKFGTTGIFGAAYGSGKFIAIGDNGKMSESEDAKIWTAILPGSGTDQTKYADQERINCIMFDGNRFITGGWAYSDITSKITYSE